MNSKTATSKRAAAQARAAGWKVGGNYSAADVRGAGQHRGHLGLVYHGITAGCFTFRCDGCGDTVFIRPSS